MKKLVACLILFVLPVMAGAVPASRVTEESLRKELQAQKRGAPRTAAYLRLGEWYRSSGENDRAERLYRQALDEKLARKDRYALLLELGDLFLSGQQYAPAIETYQEAIALLPRREDGHMRLAYAYEQSELTELARQEYLTVLERNRKSFAAVFSLATLYLEEGLTGQAMEYYRRALTIKPAPQVYRMLAQCAKNGGELDLALAMLCQITPPDRTFDDQLGIGQLFSEQKKFREAEESFSQAIKLEPDRVEGYVYLGLLYIENGQLLPAEKLFQIAQEKAPEEGLPHFFLGFIYHRQQKDDLARAEAQEAQRLSRTEILRRYSAQFSDFLSREP